MEDNIVEEPNIIKAKRGRKPKSTIIPMLKYDTKIIETPIIVHLPDGKKLTFHFPLAIIYQTKNKVKVYTAIQISLAAGKG